MVGNGAVLSSQILKRESLAAGIPWEPREESQMTDTDKALEIAEHVLLLQSQLEAAKKYILSQPGALSLNAWT